VQALIDSGIRGVHASGAPAAGEWDRQWPRISSGCRRSSSPPPTSS
jgi:hypothetical protein